MSDQTGYPAMTTDLDLEEVRAAFQAGLAARKRLTIVAGSNGLLLDGTQDEVWCAGTMTVTLPAAPNDGDAYDFLQTTNATTLTIGRNGKTIDGAAADATLAGAATNQWKTLKWSTTANTWRTR